MSEFEIVPFSDRWEEPHAEFARRNYPGKQRRADAGYLRWKFRGPATGDVEGLLVAVLDGEVIGQTGLLPGIASIDGGQQPLQWICEMMVDPDKRRLGVTRALFDAAFDRGVLTLGPDPSASAHKALAAVGMNYVQGSYVMILPLKLGPVVRTRYPQAGPLEGLLSLAGRPAIGLRNRRLAEAAHTPLAVGCPWPEVVGLVADHEARLAATHTAHAVHDEAFLSWRCAGIDPWKRSLEAIRTPAGSFAILERDPQRLTVHEWAADGPHELAALFGRVFYVAGSYGVDFIQTYAGNADERSRLEALAFQARRTRTEISVYPSGALDDVGPFAFTGYDTDYQL